MIATKNAFHLDSANAFCTAASAALGSNGTSSLLEDQKVQISVKCANSNICLNGSGEKIVLDHLKCKFFHSFDWKIPSDTMLSLRQNTRILRSDLTFAEVCKPIQKAFASLKAYSET